MAELKDIIVDHDFDRSITSSQNGINRTKIEQAIADAGLVLPLSYKVTFHYVNARGNIFAVTWFPSLDKYGYEKLTLV